MMKKIIISCASLICLAHNLLAQPPHFIITGITNATGHELTATVYDNYVMGEQTHNIRLKTGINRGSVEKPLLDLKGRSLFAVKKEIEAENFYVGKPVSFRIVNLSPRKGKHNELLLITTLNEYKNNNWTAEIKLVANGSQKPIVLGEWEESFNATFGDDIYEIWLEIFLDQNKLINGRLDAERRSKSKS